MTPDSKPHIGGDVSNLDRVIGHRLAGFVDGEGCFHIRRAKKPRTGTISYSCAFHLGLRMDDREALETWQRLTGLGVIYDSAHRFGNSKPLSMWVVNRKSETMDVVHLFEEFPLWTKKARDFEIWARAVRYWHGSMPEGWTPMEAWYYEIRDVREYEGPTRESFDVIAATLFDEFEEDDIGK